MKELKHKLSMFIISIISSKEKTYKSLLLTSIIGFVILLLVHIGTFTDINFRKYIPSMWLFGIVSFLILFQLAKTIGNVDQYNEVNKYGNPSSVTSFHINEVDTKYAPEYLKVLSIIFLVYAGMGFLFLFAIDTSPTKINGKYYVVNVRRYNPNNTAEVEKYIKEGKLREISIEEHERNLRLNDRVVSGILLVTYLFPMVISTSKINEEINTRRTKWTNSQHHYALSVHQ